MIRFKFFVSLMVILPLCFILFFSYTYEKQFSHPTLQHGTYSLQAAEGKLFQLHTGWQYVRQGESTVHALAMTPTALHTNKITTFTLPLQLPEAGRLYSLSLKGMQQPFEVWLNEELVAKKQLSEANALIHFYAQEATLELKLVMTPMNGRISFLQTPVIGDMESVQSLLFKQLIIVLVAIISLLIFGLYSISLYFSKQKQAIHLIIGIYFLLVCSSLLFSTSGMGLPFFQFSPTLQYKLKTIFGLLTVTPLYIIVKLLYKQRIARNVLMLIVLFIVASVVVISLVPFAMYIAAETYIWGCLTILLLIQFMKICFIAVKTQQMELKSIFLMNTLFYLVVYLSLRVYYQMYGTDAQTSIWLIMFAISICVYMMVYQNNLVTELENAKIDAVQSKISFFNAQIKPHFLYNALSNIIALCYTDHLKAAHLLGKFSTYLRIIFENNVYNDWLTVEKELSLIDAYIEIEKARFSNKIDYVLAVEERAKHMKVPTLLIQPFVENAIRHGLFNKEEGGTVYVKIEQHATQLVITIQDDGVGMSQQQLARVLKGEHLQQGIGVMNVVQRLALIPHSEFDMHSARNEGTYICIRVPINAS